jgi:hypothetical protein
MDIPLCDTTDLGWWQSHLHLHLSQLAVNKPFLGVLNLAVLPTKATGVPQPWETAARVEAVECLGVLLLRDVELLVEEPPGLSKQQRRPICNPSNNFSRSRSNLHRRLCHP